jgi:Helix-turn-helix domain
MSDPNTEVVEDRGFMSIRDVAAFLGGISERQVRNLFYDGLIGPDITIGRKRVYDRSAVEAYAERLRSGAA